MLTDLQIAQAAVMQPITQIARQAGVREDSLSCYGRYIAKVDPTAYQDQPPRARLILVTAITPTPAGEGKTTVSVSLADGMRRNGKNAMLALREPSQGPVFGIKGGAAGGGYAQVLPMENTSTPAYTDTPRKRARSSNSPATSSSMRPTMRGEMIS